MFHITKWYFFFVYIRVVYHLVKGVFGEVAFMATICHLVIDTVTTIKRLW